MTTFRIITRVPAIITYTYNIDAASEEEAANMIQEGSVDAWDFTTDVDGEEEIISISI